MTTTPKLRRQTITTDEGSLTLSGVALIEPTPEGAQTARELIDAAAQSGITSMKMRRFGRYSVSLVRGQLTPIASVKDSTLALGAGPLGILVRRH